MKRYNIFIVAMALCTLLWGCAEPEPEVFEPALTLEQTTIEATADGGNYTIGYTLENPTPGAKLTLTPEFDWVTNITVGDGVISFDVKPSYSPEERSCRIDVSYPGIYPNKTIVVHQGEGKEHSIDIVLKEANATYVTLDILPKNKNLSYVFILGNGKYIEQNGLMEDDEALWASDMDIFQGFADAFGVDVSAAVTAFMYQGEKIDYVIKGVSPSTRYVAYAYGFDQTTMTPTTEICRLVIDTKTVDDYIVEFDFDVEVNGPDVAMDITAVNYDGPFFFGVFDAKACPESMPDEEFRGYCEAAWEEQKGVYSSFFETPEQGLHFIFNELAYYDTTHLEVELDANTEYVLWAFGMNSEALLNTTPQRYYFSTGSVTGSTNTFEVSVTDVKSRRATINVTPSNDDSYVVVLGTPSRYEGLNDEEVMHYITTNYSLNYNTGAKSDVATGLLPSTEYEIFVFGCKAGCPTTDLVRYKFTTDEVVYAELDFEMHVGEHYDVNEVIALDEKWAAYAGNYCIVPVSVTVDDAAENFYYSLFYSDTLKDMPYENIIAGLLAESESDVSAVYVLDYDVAFTFFGVAEDADGNFTEVWQSKSKIFKYADRSNAQEFVDATNSATPASRSLVYDVAPVAEYMSL